MFTVVQLDGGGKGLIVEVEIIPTQQLPLVSEKEIVAALFADQLVQIRNRADTLRQVFGIEIVKCIVQIDSVALSLTRLPGFQTGKQLSIVIKKGMGDAIDLIGDQGLRMKMSVASRGAIRL